LGEAWEEVGGEKRSEGWDFVRERGISDVWIVMTRHSCLRIFIYFESTAIEPSRPSQPSLVLLGQRVFSSHFAWAHIIFQPKCV
jgi:hypothetical protein